MNTRNFLHVALFVALIGGCSSADKRSYSVVVDNRSDLPVTVWLTQNHPVRDPAWMSPETMAIAYPGESDPPNRVVVPPGKVANTVEMTGKFPRDVDGVLRVYIGERTFDEILAMSRDNPNRFDVRLTPGRNELVLTEQGGRVVAHRGGVAEPATNPSGQ